MDNIFIVVLKYIVAIEEIDACRLKHLEFLGSCYEQGILIASGPQVPRNGGILIAKSSSKEALQNILGQDPFAINKCAEYSIYEFTPTKYAKEFEAILQK
jgi:uncharacterized protein YciI